MGKNLVVVGSGSYARQVLDWIVDTGLSGEQAIKGYLDSGAADEWLTANHACLGSCGDYVPEKEDLFVCALLDPIMKLTVCRRIQERGGGFHTFIHAASGIPRRTILGPGCVLGPGSGLTCDIILGEFVTVQPHAGIGHDVHVGAGATIGAHCLLAGEVRLGEGVVLQPNVVVLPHVRIGDRCRVGAGSVVVYDVAPGTSVWGVPARTVDVVIEAV